VRETVLGRRDGHLRRSSSRSSSFLTGSGMPTASIFSTSSRFLGLVVAFAELFLDGFQLLARRK
jgi:hypothetical protein